MAVYTTSDLIDSIVNRGQFPDSTNTKTISSPVNLLRIATEEMRAVIVPMVVAVHDDFYVRSIDITVVSGQVSYPISSRSVGVGLRSIRLFNDGTELDFAKVDPDEANNSITGVPDGYYFEDNKIVLNKTPETTGLTIKTRIYMRPNRLEQVSNCAVISSINTATNTVTCTSTLPSTWGVGTSLDLIAKTAPYSWRAIDQAITATSGTDVTFASLPSDLVVGDYLCPAEYSCLPQIPEDFQPLLSQRTVKIVLEAIKDSQGLANAEKTLKEYAPAAESILTPRDESHPQKLVRRNWR